MGKSFYWSQKETGKWVISLQISSASKVGLDAPSAKLLAAGVEETAESVMGRTVNTEA